MKLNTILIILLVCSTTSIANEQPASKTLLLDNSAVEVVRLTYPAGTESGMHTHQHPNRVVYFVKGGTLALVPEDKQQQTKVITVADGKTLFLPAATHNVKNIGQSEIIIVETELKSN